MFESPREIRNRFHGGGTGRRRGLVLLGRAASALVLLLLLAGTSLRAEVEPPAGHDVVVDAGSRRTGGLFVAGRGARIDGRLDGDLVLVGADALISGSVDGDVVAWGGRLRLSGSAEVSGSILLVGAKFVPEPSAKVRGKTLDWADLGEVGQALLAGRADVGVAAVRRWIWGARLASLAAWLCASLLLSFVATAAVERAAESLRLSIVRSFFAGLAAFLALFLLAWFFLDLVPFGVGLPFLVFLAAAGVAGKVFGMTAVFVAVGRWIGRLRGAKVPLASPTATAAGLLLLGTVRLIPWIGTPVWVAASLAGLGAVVWRVVGRS